MLEVSRPVLVWRRDFAWSWTCMSMTLTWMSMTRSWTWPRALMTQGLEPRPSADQQMWPML